MDKMDFEIEIQDNPDDAAVGVQLPLNFITIGEIENDDIKVYIKQDVYRALEEFAASDTQKELGSIILGNYCQDAGKMHVVLSDYIEAKYTDASASTLTFTHETWDYIHKEHERRYPDKKIIGWQHTHPNYGIFLSNYDMFIQENFFNMPFQVAYVIDPVQGQRGFFQWKNGRVEKLKGYYLYDAVGTPIKVEQKKIKSRPEKGQAKPSRLLYSAVGILGITTIVLAAAVVFLAGKYQKQAGKQKAVLKEIENQNAMLFHQEDKLSKIQKQLEDENKNKDINADEKTDEITDGKDSAIVQFKVYTVVQGDTLMKICETNNIDYAANRKIILAINGIEDAGRIYAGQRLLLPLEGQNQ